MPELTEVGTEAMARELHRLASDGQRDWDQETPQLRQDLLGFVDQMVAKAAEAEERATR